MDTFCGSEFQDSNGTFMGSKPIELIECFQYTVLIWVPTGYIILMAPIYIFILFSFSKAFIQHSWLNVTKTILCCLLLLLSSIDVVYRLYYSHIIDQFPFRAHILPSFLTLIAMGASLLLVQVGRMKGERTSGILFIYWLLQLLSALFILQSHIRALISKNKDDFMIYNLTYISVFTLLVFAQFLFSGFIVDKVGEFSDSSTEDHKKSPENDASFLSVVTFWWFSGFMVNGYRRLVKTTDLWSLNPQDDSTNVIPQFEKYWKNELQRSYRSRLDQDFFMSQDVYGSMIMKSSHKTNDDDDDDDDEEEDGLRMKSDEDKEGESELKHMHKKKKKAFYPRLWVALVCAFWSSFILGSFLKFINSLLLFVSPLLLQLMIAFVHDKNKPSWHGFTYAVLMFVTALIQSLVLQQYFHKCMIVGMRIRTVLIASIYNKSLRLSNSARRVSTVGEIVNLMSVDAQRFVELTTYLDTLWSAPLQISVCLYFLWLILGPSILAGFAVMILMIPLNVIITKKMQALQIVQMKHKDTRIKLMNEVLNGIKVLKLYAWEVSFEEKVLKIRNDELNVLRKFAYLNAANSFTWTCAPFIVSLTTFTVYVLSSEQNILDAEKAFVALSLFNILRFPLAMFPSVISGVVQASVSLKRLEKFLMNEELQKGNVEHNMDNDSAVSIESGTFGWQKKNKKYPPTLENINLEIRSGSLVGIIGQVGCGKSTLLSAILGETEKIKGRVVVKGSTSYVAQQAWIQNATVEDNILFKKAKDNLFYKKVLDGCALVEDLKMFAGGDQTEIGDKGINLSGGQKQRLSLARAVYFDADLYLLDDPLSAVDSHVGKHIFEQVLGKNGILRNKTRILVTHGISFLHQLDLIVVMVDGRISEIGTYYELLDQNRAFSDFLRIYFENETLEEDVDDEDIQLREEILSHIGSSTDLRVSLERLNFRRMESTKSDDSVLNEELQSSLKEKDLKRMKTMEEFDERRSSGLAGKDEAEILTLENSSGNGLKKTKFELSHSKKEERNSLLHQPQKQLSGLETEDPEMQQNENEKQKLTQVETVEIGSVKLSVFLTYVKSIGILVSIGILFLYVVNNALAVYANFWLSDWSNDEAINGTMDTKQRDLRLGVYAILGLAQGFLEMTCAISMALGGIVGSRVLFCRLLQRMLRAPLLFFERNPKGRILSRLSEDILAVDHVLPFTVRSIINTILSAFATIFVIAFNLPLFLTTFPFLAAAYFFIQRFYVSTSRQLCRLESISRSPIYSHFTETLNGASTIRAFQQSDRFIRESEKRVDENQMMYYPGIVSHRWLAVRLEFIGNCLVLSAAIFAAFGRDHLTPGIVGLSISYALNMTQTLNWMVRMSSELETNNVAIERIKEYSQVETEAAWINDLRRPDAEWPTKGHIEYHDYSVSYRKELDPVLNGITCNILDGEKIGIVGRTGAGKSSLVLGTFRIIEPTSGTIVIDGLDISQIGLHDLRSKITVIPQDPVIFSGTIRMNLDPFNKHSDDDIWKALEQSHLKPYIAEQTKQLEHECSEGGSNLCEGHRQLICLARALLRKTKILILDEATSSVDMETDDFIQSTIREQFTECTVLTIAHRLHTIMDYDRIMVIDAGEMKEFDSPEALLTNKDGIFYKMAEDAKITG